MNEQERQRVAEVIAEAAKLLEFAQAALKRAGAQCDGDLRARVEVIAKRAYELKVKSEWLRCSALGQIELPAQQRGAADRRMAIDRRIPGMLKQMLSAAA